MIEAEKRETEEKGEGEEGEVWSRHAYLSCSMSSRRVLGFSRKQSVSTDWWREGKEGREREEE